MDKPYAAAATNTGGYFSTTNAIVKAFDTTNYQLLIGLLRQIGAPRKLYPSIERMYNGLKVIMKLGSEKAEIPQSTGLRQGDNLSPVFFLFPVSALAGALETKWIKSDMHQDEHSRVAAADLEKSGGLFLGRELSKMGFYDGITFKGLQIRYQMELCTKVALRMINMMENIETLKRNLHTCFQTTPRLKWMKMEEL